MEEPTVEAALKDLADLDNEYKTLEVRKISLREKPEPKPDCFCRILAEIMRANWRRLANYSRNA